MSVTSTIDRIKDTTIMRMIRKMAGVIDEQTASVKAVNDKLDNFNIDGVETQLAKNTSDIGQLKISDNEHTAQITTLETNVDNNAHEITAIKVKDTAQDSEIAGLTESVVSDLTATFDNNTRNLKISIEREKATSIDATVNIPASAQTGTYSAIAPITINDTNQIGIAIDSSSMEITAEGTLKSKGSGSSYTAGTGIEIVDGVIQLTNQYDAWLKNAYNNGSYVDSTDKKFIFKTKSGINDKVSLIALAFKSDISDMETKTDASATYATKTELNTKANKDIVDDLSGDVDACFKGVSISGNTLTFVTVDSQNIPVELPGGGSGDYVPATYPVEQGGKILGISGDGTVQPKDSSFVEPLFKANHTYFTSPSNFMTSLTAGIKIGNMISFFALGKTATSWSGTITGVVTEKSSTAVTINYIGGILQENNIIIPIGCTNYTTQPSIIFSEGGIHINIVKGNSIEGRNLSWDDVQGYNTIIYR
jgi:hypothetical protein